MPEKRQRSLHAKIRESFSIGKFARNRFANHAIRSVHQGKFNMSLSDPLSIVLVPSITDIVTGTCIQEIFELKMNRFWIFLRLKLFIWYLICLYLYSWEADNIIIFSCSVMYLVYYLVILLFYLYIFKGIVFYITEMDRHLQ